MKKLLWPIPVVGMFVAALATAQEPAPKPTPHSMSHGMMRDGAAMPMGEMGAMMETMRSMSPEDRAKMMENCRQMMESIPADSTKCNK